MKITEELKQQNTLKAIRFERPDFIPIIFWINYSCWNYYPHEALFDLMESHPFLYPDFKRPASGKMEFDLTGTRNSSKAPYTDSFGCVWETTIDGIVGTVTKHPLENWDNFKTWQPPDPEVCDGVQPIDWKKVEKTFRKHHEEGTIAPATLRHGHTFLQLCDLRGYTNLMMDMADEDPRLLELIDIVESFNMTLVKKFIALGADRMGYPDDMGMQFGPMLTPEHFRKYIKPSYKRLIKPARDAGLAIHMHSDGDIRTLVDDLIEGGVECINLQDLVNGIDWIQEHLKGKVCVDLDIDRQQITPYGTPEQIDALVREEIQKLGSKEGGLTMIYGMYPGVPLENAKALMDALEKYAFYYS